jgi:iron complex transport system ATP-binding protein
VFGRLPATERGGEVIVLDGVTKRYGRALVVDDVSVRIARGGITAIIGPNGAGKSTLLSIACRLSRQDAGSVSIDGDDIARWPSDELARRVAVLRQDYHLAVRLTVEDLVAFGRYPHSKGRPTVADRKQIEAAIEYLELGELRKRFLDQLSGGQRQRAFVAMVLCQDTDYVLLDEPLASLDMRHAVAMMKRLRRVTSELGKTVVLVLHDINFASAYADSIIALKNGRLVHHAAPNEVMTPGVLREIYDMSVNVHEIDGQQVGVYFR